MKTFIQITKIKTVLLYIMQSFPKGVECTKLFRILYFAQQDYLVKYGKVLIEDSFMALKYGPVPTYIYKVLQAVEEKPTEEGLNDFLTGIEVHEKKIYASAKPDMDYISGSDKRCLDAAITKYRDTDPYDLSDLSHDSAWKEAKARIKDAPQKNLVTIIDLARAGKAKKEMIDFYRQIRSATPPPPSSVLGA